MVNRLYLGKVGSKPNSIDNHISKHDLNCDRKQYLTIGYSISKGEQGVHTGTYKDRKYTVVVEGKVCEPHPDDERRTQVYGLLRSVRRGN